MYGGIGWSVPASRRTGPNVRAWLCLVLLRALCWADLMMAKSDVVEYVFGKPIDGLDKVEKDNEGESAMTGSANRKDRRCLSALKGEEFAGMEETLQTIPTLPGMAQMKSVNKMVFGKAPKLEKGKSLWGRGEGGPQP